MDECHVIIGDRKNIWSDRRVVPALLLRGTISVVATATVVTGATILILVTTATVIAISDLNMITNENILRGASVATAARERN